MTHIYEGMNVVFNPSRWRQISVRRNELDIRIIPLGFLTLIAIGALLLVLPWAHRDGQTLKPVDALFLATSATCVTGLSSVDISATFNLFGQIILFCLIQLGGIGIVTATILFAILGKRRLSVLDEQVIQASFGKLRQARPKDIFIHSCLFVFMLEMLGAAILFFLMNRCLPGQSVWQTLWEACFHAVSAFCNAGISIYPEGMARWKNEPVILVTIDTLVILGGIGVMALVNLRYYRFWKRDPRMKGTLTLQTKLSVVTTIFLLVIGMLATLVFERESTLAKAHGWDCVSWSLFHSTMTRTAGFNVVDVGQMNPPTLLVTTALMMIGGSPGSMAGGIKTVTLALLILTTWNALRRRNEIQVFGRRVPSQLPGIATMICLLAVSCVASGIGLLMLTETGQASSMTGQHWLGIAFEAVSAFGTVGLSTGVTPLLTIGGKFIIMTLMFAGRVGPLVLSIYLARPANLLHVRYPREELSLG